MNPRSLWISGSLLLALGLRPLAPETFRFKYIQDEQYRILTEVQEKVYINGNLSHRADILNKIAVDTLAVKEGAGMLLSTFQVAERSYGAHDSFSLAEDYQSTFWRDELGNYDIGSEYFMPVIRNVPRFPEQDIPVGHAWSAEGEEVHDFRRSYRINRPLRFPITVNYTFQGKEEQEGRTLGLLKIHYTVFHRLEPLSTAGNPVPVKITGVSDQLYYWDFQAGKPRSYQERFDFIFHLSNGDVVEYEGSAQGRLVESPKLDRDKVVEELQRELAERGIEDASVKAEDSGVTLTLENIQFPPNSARLWDSEKEKLRAIAQVLKDYPERDFLITGHTARAEGYTEQDFQQLSEQRAKAVGDFLLELGAIRETGLTTRGMGIRQPLADNASEAGRRLNRRVEITILEN